jgi:archaellin
VGAFTPAEPALKVDYATTSSITLIWDKVKNATSYDVYKSNDGLHWEKTPYNTSKTTYTIKKLTENHRYTFYVVARNDNNGVDENGEEITYTALCDNSNILNQKAVVKRRPMTLTGFPTEKSPNSGSTLTVTIKINPPLGRKASLQMKSGKKWVTK